MVTSLDKATYNDFVVTKNSKGFNIFLPVSIVIGSTM